MKRIALICLAVGSLGLSSCTTVAGTMAASALDAAVSAAKPAAAVSDKVVLEGKRGLILASNAYQGAVAVVVPLINADKLTPAQVERVAALNERVASLLRGTEAGLSLAERAAGIFNAANELHLIAGR